MTGNGSLRGWIVAGAVLVAAFAGAAQASEPVSSSYILEKLAPITGEEEGRSIDLDITFDLGSARLSKEAVRQLEALGQALTSAQLANARIGIYGHTDASGRAVHNKKLSEDRAASVKAYLVATFKIDAGRLFTAGYGEEKLKNAAAPNAAENRRVQIVNLSPMPSRPPQPSQPAKDAAPVAPTGGMQAIQ